MTSTLKRGGLTVMMAADLVHHFSSAHPELGQPYKDRYGKLTPIEGPIWKGEYLDAGVVVGFAPYEGAGYLRMVERGKIHYRLADWYGPWGKEFIVLNFAEREILSKLTADAEGTVPFRLLLTAAKELAS